MDISRHKLEKTASKRSLAVRKQILEYSGDGRLPNTKFGSNVTNGVTIGGQRKDVFLLRGGDGVHDELKYENRIKTGYIAFSQALFDIKAPYKPSIKNSVPLETLHHQILIFLTPTHIIVPMCS